MAAGSTYEPIATQTLASAASSVTFSSITGSYTDLVLVGNYGLSSASQLLEMRLNSDTGTNYSYTYLSGDGSSATSGRYATQNFIPINWISPSTTITTATLTNINNYSNTTTYKTVLTRSNNANTGTDAIVSLWRNTAAITTILLFSSSGNILSGSTFTLYGIKAA